MTAAAPRPEAGANRTRADRGGTRWGKPRTPGPRGSAARTDRRRGVHPGGYSPSHPSLQSQSLSRSYGSNLPTSLTYINLSTRDSKPWRPAADSVQAVESLRAPVFDFQGPRREYRHSNLIPCSTSLSNHISLWKTSMASVTVKQKRELFRYLLLASRRKGFMLPWLQRRYRCRYGTPMQTYTQQAPEL